MGPGLCGDPSCFRCGNPGRERFLEKLYEIFDGKCYDLDIETLVKVIEEHWPALTAIVEDECAQAAAEHLAEEALELQGVQYWVEPEPESPPSFSTEDTMETEITKLPEAEGLLSRWTFPDGTVQIRCVDCNAWAYADSKTSIRHTKRCATPHAQPVSAPSPQPSSSVPRTANGLSSEELLAAVQRGYLTQTEAMNRDF